MVHDIIIQFHPLKLTWPLEIGYYPKRKLFFSNKAFIQVFFLAVSFKEGN